MLFDLICVANSINQNTMELMSRLHQQLIISGQQQQQCRAETTASIRTNHTDSVGYQNGNEDNNNDSADYNRNYRRHKPQSESIAVDYTNKSASFTTISPLDLSVKKRQESISNNETLLSEHLDHRNGASRYVAKHRPPPIVIDFSTAKLSDKQVDQHHYHQHQTNSKTVIISSSTSPTTANLAAKRLKASSNRPSIAKVKSKTRVNGSHKDLNNNCSPATTSSVDIGGAVFAAVAADIVISSTNGQSSHRNRKGRATRANNKQKGIKNHLCNQCGRSFSRSDMLTRHSRLHSGLKPYQCGKCLQVFSRSDHLSTHERTHTGEKPYQCEFCAYSACRRDMITRHMRTHTGHLKRVKHQRNSAITKSAKSSSQQRQRKQQQRTKRDSTVNYEANYEALIVDE